EGLSGAEPVPAHAAAAEPLIAWGGGRGVAAVTPRASSVEPLCDAAVVRAGALVMRRVRHGAVLALRGRGAGGLLGRRAGRLLRPRPGGLARSSRRRLRRGVRRRDPAVMAARAAAGV